MSLSPKQAEFCRQYLVDLNATQAAIRAGYSEQTAKAQGSRLLTNVDVASEIERLGVERFQRTGFDADRVLKEIERIATADIRKAIRWGMKPVTVYLDGEGKQLDPADAAQAVQEITELKPFAEPINSDELDDDTAASIAEVKQTKFGLSIRMHPKTTGLELSARHFGMLKDKVEVTVDDDLAAVLAAARQRAGE